LGLDYATTQWDLINQNADQYLDSVNAIYSVQKLQSKYLDAIDDTSSVTAQKKLNDLMQKEISYLQEQDKLTQYDVDRAELRYQIALKQIALEEAQQNKSTMRLRRDSQGNYSYQFVADTSEVDSIKSNLSDLYNQLYNLDTDQYQSNLNDLYDIWVEFQEKLSEAAQINDPEERQERELLLREQYGQLINGLTEQNENIRKNLYESTTSELLDLYSLDVDNFENMTAEEQELVNLFMNNYTDASDAAFDNLFNLYDANLENFETMTEEQIETLMDSLVPQ
jgi:hypothetical protein